MENKTDARWRKSNYSGNLASECVEVGNPPGAIAVRDTVNRDSGALTFTAAAWKAFTSSLK